MIPNRGGITTRAEGDTTSPAHEASLSLRDNADTVTAGCARCIELQNKGRQVSTLGR